MPRYHVQFKHRPGAASVAITADNAEMAISEAASVLRLTPMDIGDPINDVVDFACILEAIEQTTAKPDLYKSIQGQDHRSIVVDQFESEVYIATHVPGGFSSITLSRDAAIELVAAIQSILGADNA